MSSIIEHNPFSLLCDVLAVCYACKLHDTLACATRWTAAHMVKHVLRLHELAKFFYAPVFIKQMVRFRNNQSNASLC